MESGKTSAWEDEPNLETGTQGCGDKGADSHPSIRQSHVLDFTFDDYETEPERLEVIHGIKLKNQNNKVFYDKLTDFVIRRVPSMMGFVIEGCPAGDGRLDIPWLLDCLRAAGRYPNAILELWTPLAGTLEETIVRETAWAEKSIAKLRQFIAS